MKKLLLIASVLLMFVSVTAFGQRKKDKVKDKHFEPVVWQNIKNYAGKYVGIEDTYFLEIRVGTDGKLQGSLQEGARRASLKDIKIEGSKLTATKVYEDGSKGAFEGEFVNRVLNGASAFGIIVDVSIKLDDDVTLSNLFYRRR